MVITNALSIYILKHEQDDIFEQNFHSIQDDMRSDKLVGSKFKRVSTELLNLMVLA